jgi:hypothetical protein
MKLDTWLFHSCVVIIRKTIRHFEASGSVIRGVQFLAQSIKDAFTCDVDERLRDVGRKNYVYPRLSVLYLNYHRLHI